MYKQMIMKQSKANSENVLWDTIYNSANKKVEHMSQIYCHNEIE